MSLCENQRVSSCGFAAGFHRGQITTLLRQRGAAAPAIDYLVKYEAENDCQAVGARG